MKKLFSLLMITTVVFITACSNSSEEANSEEPIEIGAIFPMSGENAQTGTESFRGVELAVEEFNENGGLDGREIKIEKSDAPDEDSAQSEANRLISQKNIDIIVGSYASGISYAASEVAERNNAFYWELGAVADNITERKYKSVMRTNPLASQFSQTHLNFIKDVVTEELDMDVEDLNVAVVHEDGSYGTTIAERFEELAEKEGINVSSLQPYDSESNDLSPVILNLKKEEPDVLIAVSYPNDAILLTKQMKELDLEVPVFLGSGGGHTISDFEEGVGDKAEGLFNTDFTQFNTDTDQAPGLDDFIDAYEEKYETNPHSGHSLTNYMGMKVVLDVLKETGGDTDSEKLREAALDYKIEKGETATGWGVDFDSETGQNTASEPYVTQWRDGELITVYPKEAAVEEPKIEK